MRVFHGPLNISGMAGILAAAERTHGVESRSYCLKNKFNFPSDKTIPNLRNPFGYLKFLFESALFYDVYHFYFGHSLLGPLLYDLKWLKRFNKKIFFYFCGCDIRDSKLVVQKYRYSACRQCWPMHCSKNRVIAKQSALEYANQIFVSTPDLLEFVEGSILLPQPIDLQNYAKIRESVLGCKTPAPNKVKVIHAPSNGMLKGTAYIKSAVAKLQSQGCPIEFILLENYTHADAMRICAEADIVVDQLLIGAYGQYSVEAMAMGKPVICYLREDLIDKYPSVPPVLNANVETFADVLKQLVDDVTQRERLGLEGLAYVTRVHAADVIAEKTLNYYAS